MNNMPNRLKQTTTLNIRKRAYTVLLRYMLSFSFFQYLLIELLLKSLKL